MQWLNDYFWYNNERFTINYRGNRLYLVHVFRILQYLLMFVNCYFIFFVYYSVMLYCVVSVSVALCVNECVLLWCLTSNKHSAPVWHGVGSTVPRQTFAADEVLGPFPLLDQLLGRHAEHLDDAGHLVGLVLAGKEGEPWKCGMEDLVRYFEKHMKDIE